MFVFSKTYKIGLPIVEGLMGETTEGVPKGFPLEITELLLKQENIEFVWVKGSWTELYSKTLIGKIDALPGTQKTIERQKYLDFLENSFYTIWGELYLRESTEFISVSDLSKKKIGLVKEDNNAAGFKKYITSFDIKYQPIYFNSHKEAVDALINESIYGYVGPMASRSNPIDNKIKSSGLFFNPTDMTIAFPKGKNPELKNILDRRLYLLKGDDNSEYSKLFKKYNLGTFRDTKEKLPNWAYYFLAILGVSIIISTLFILLLRTQVRLKTKELQERETLLKTSLSTGNMGVWHYDLDTQILQISEDFTSTNELSLKVYHLNDIKKKVSKWQIAKTTFLFNKSKNELSSIDTQIDFINDKGDLVHTRLTGKVVKNMNENTFSANGIIQNISKQKNYEKELILAKKEAQKSEKLMSSFLASMSHEIRTPLNAILGFSNIIASNNTTSNKKEDYKKIINTQGQLLLTLVNDLLDMAKIEAGTMSVQNEIVEANQLVLDVINSFLSQNRNNTKIIVKVPHNENLYIEADKSRTFQILNNLILNAEKHSKGKDIEVGIKEKKGNVFIYVKDKGPGIAKEKQETIFNRFKKLDIKVQGTGLGLAISKSLANLMNAELILKSETDTGAEFMLLFKKMENQISQTDKTFHDTAVMKSDRELQILVVEDIQSNFLLIETFLLDITSHITWAKNGEEAIELNKKKDFDIILMDLQMPVMDGFEATKAIKQTTPHIPIVALTAHAFIADIRKAEKSGCDAYITKPVDYEDLMNKISKLTNIKV